MFFEPYSLCNFQKTESTNLKNGWFKNHGNLFIFAFWL